MSNWGTLYLILRANFDGKTSDMMPNSPPSNEGDGKVAYRAGKRAVGLAYSKQDGIVNVEFEDVKSGERHTISAEIVIAADGVHSTVRKILHVPSEKRYPGYIGWRGTVSERLLSPETVEYFSDRLNFSLMKGTYCIR
jgi:2-polyprenyl-6-methoxyphenol hydroxylase-like FAD-dependent oxidoreductase